MAIGGYAVDKKKVHLIFLVDLSGSMASRVPAVNAAMRELGSICRELQNRDDCLGVEINIRIIEFKGNSAHYIIGSRESGVTHERYRWIDKTKEDCAGVTPTEMALAMVNDICDDNNWKTCLGNHTAAPLIALVSDGLAQKESEFNGQLAKLTNTKIGKAASLVSIGININKLSDPKNVEIAKRQLSAFGRNGIKYIDTDDTANLAKELAKVVKVATVATTTDAANKKDNNRGDYVNTSNIFE